MRSRTSPVVSPHALLAAWCVASKRTNVEIARLLGVHPRTVARWRAYKTTPRARQWPAIVAGVATWSPDDARAIAKAADVPSPVPEPKVLDPRVVDDAIVRAADVLDVAPKRVKEALRGIVETLRREGGTLEDLAGRIEAGKEKK